MSPQANPGSCGPLRIASRISGRSSQEPVRDAVGAGVAAGAHRMEIVAHEDDAGQLGRGGERAEQQVAEAGIVVERDDASAQPVGQELDLIAGRAQMKVEVLDLGSDAELGGLAQQLVGVALGDVERQQQHGRHGTGDQQAEAEHQHDRDRRPPARRRRAHHATIAGLTPR